MLTAGLVGILVILLRLAVPIGLLAALQVWLCRRKRRLGLILPGVFLALSLALCLGCVGFVSVTGGSGVRIYDESGALVREERMPPDPEQKRALALAVGGIFLCANLPTVLFGGIWLCSREQNRSDEMNRMNIQDLE